MALSGPLGAGKTTFVQGLVAGLSSPEQVTSPTFVLMQVYDRGRLPVYHFDAYRLDHGRQLVEIGAEDYFWGDGVTLMEWPEKVEEVLPDDRLRVSFAIPEEARRELTLTASGSRSEAILRELSCC